MCGVQQPGSGCSTVLGAAQALGFVWAWTKQPANDDCRWRQYLKRGLFCLVVHRRVLPIVPHSPVRVAPSLFGGLVGVQPGDMTFAQIVPDCMWGGVTLVANWPHACVNFNACCLQRHLWLPGTRRKAGAQQSAYCRACAAGARQMLVG